jgi:hypothetical protein
LETRPAIDGAGSTRSLHARHFRIFKMIDAASGREWRYTHVTPHDEQVQRYVDRLIRSEELKRAQPFSFVDLDRIKVADDGITRRG